MHYVYLPKNEHRADRRYVGVTANLKQRLIDHNSGKSPHTAKYVPWFLIAYVAFSDKRKANAFEHYLDSPSSTLPNKIVS